MPRSQDPERDAAAIAATREFLATVGYDGFSMADVAHRIGGSKPTLYRRWPSKADLVITAVTGGSTPDYVPRGNLRQDLCALATANIRADDALSVPVLAGVLWAMRTHPDLAAAVQKEIVNNRVTQFHNALQAACDRGELAHMPSHWRRIADLLPAAIMYQFATDTIPDDKWLTDLIDTVILPLVIQPEQGRPTAS